MPLGRLRVKSLLQVVLMNFIRHPGYLVICMFLLPILYLAYYYNVWEYVRTTPFAYFEYPLEVDMEQLVENVLSNNHPGVDPLNDKSSYQFLINNETKCQDEEGNKDNIFILLLIKSRLQNFEQRQMIRRTWGREYMFGLVSIRRVFLLGIDPGDVNIQHRIEREHQNFTDIAQQNFIDSYYNNTIKMMMGFQWAVQYCRTAQFIAFFDDDYFVNINNVVPLLQSVTPTEMNNLVIGYLWGNSLPFRIKGNKWYISLKEYPFRFYPPFVAAGSFFVPMITAQRIYIAMLYTKIIRFDDVYLGIVMWKLKIKIKHNPDLYVFDYEYNRLLYRTVVAATGFQDVALLHKCWKEQMEFNKA